MNHALDCKKSGLITARYDESRDELRDLLAHMISPSRIRCEPMIIPAPMHVNDTKTRILSASSSSDGCGESKKFDVNHALDYKKGGLVTA